VDLLWVEDDLTDRELILRVLRETAPSLHIRTASGGREALAWLEPQNASLPRAVLLDLNLPDMSGIEVLPELLQNVIHGWLRPEIAEIGKNPEKSGARAGAEDWPRKRSIYRAAARLGIPHRHRLAVTRLVLGSGPERQLPLRGALRLR
jgi:CheY-like chemotaxis protein